MATIIYERIDQLCKEQNISINKLESILGFGPSSLQKWKTTTSPSVEKVAKVAEYFNVAVDYLIGRSDVRSTAQDILNDDDFVSLQRAKENMPFEKRERFRKFIQAGFEYAFKEDD